VSVSLPSFACDIILTQSSTYLRNLTKEWDGSYERLTGMVVPRSSVFVPFLPSFLSGWNTTDVSMRAFVDDSKLAEDEEYVLYSVTIFRRIKDEFSQKAREKKSVLTLLPRG
jgi:V-type H+-transporting ATPase subunit C